MESLLVQLQEPNGRWTDVGALHSRNDQNWFDSFSDYWQSPIRPVLGQQFEEMGPSWKPNARAALPHWFSHLLPEGALRQETAHAASINIHREFQLLKRLGQDDLPGAVRAVPLELDRHQKPPVLPLEDAPDSSPILKFSLAGVQLKFSVSSQEKGPTVPVAGTAGDAILKLPDGRPGFEGVPEAEYAGMMLAREAGIRVPPVELVDARNIAGLEKWAAPFNGSSLLIARYDRKTEDQRVHSEEFAQIMGISATKTGAKYKSANFETIANISAKLNGLSSVGEVIDRIVLNVLIGNGDAHLKNWSIIYPDGRSPVLSPAYDIVPTVLYLTDDDLGLNLGKTKDFSAISVENFDRMGDVTGYGITQARQRAAAAAERVMDNWAILRELLTYKQYDFLTSRLEKLPLVN